MFRKRGEGPAPRPPVTTADWDPLSTPHSYVSDFQPEPLPRVYSDYRAMLADDDVDAVLILTPLDTHHSIALASLAAGNHVMVEKPLAITVRAGRRMVDLARRRGLVLATAEVARYLPDARSAWWAIQSGRIGKLQVVVGGGIGAGQWSPDFITAETPWRHQKLHGGGGPAIDFGPHYFNILGYAGDEIAEVSGLVQTLEPVRVTRDANGDVVDQVRNEVDDLFFASLRFAGGAVGQFLFCWAGHGEQVSLPLSYYGDRGSLVENRLTLDDGTVQDVLEAFEKECDPAIKARLFPLGLRDGFALEIYDWLQAIQHGREAEVTGADGLRDLAISYAVIESSLARRWVSIEEVESGAVDAYQREIDEYYGLRDS